MKRIVTAIASTAIVAAGLVGIVAVSNDTAEEPLAVSAPVVCDPLDSGKIDTTGDPLTVRMTAPEGYVITQYCVKAGSVISVPPPGPVRYFDVVPQRRSILVGHPSGKAVSHYSYAYKKCECIETTTTVPETTTTSTTTTLPETTTTAVTTTTTLPETTTTAPTTTVVETTTTVPETTTTQPTVQITTTTKVTIPATE